ncbi:MAG: AAA family ATPase [Ktedonobacteraceae bacterium]|nr:AAA family ATPase [Ktedonobacteraceae bacterium]
MIILKHLIVEHFRLLRSLNLHFPRRGSILIQGPNESGKSALLESIYFALYGEPLNTDFGRHWLDDLIQYGTNSATVTLSLVVGSSDMTITRTIERGKGQRVSLHLQRPGMGREEPITRLGTAHDRITSELGGIDGETLRNSFLIEQKGLNRLESLSGVGREATIRRVLGLENLTRLTESFIVTPHDEQLLKECTERLHLAEIQARIPDLSRELDLVEAALDAVSVCDDLQEVKQQEADIAEQESALEQLQARRSELKGTLGRIQQLKKADAILGQIITAYDDMAEARNKAPELEKQLSDLDHREHEELPALERRVNDLVELTQLFGTLQRISSDLLVSVDTVKDLEQDIKQQDEASDILKHIRKQIVNTQAQMSQVQHRLQEAQEQRDIATPILAARLLRLKTLKERLTALRKVEEQYIRHVTSKGLAEENEAQLTKAQKDLDETQQELARVEQEVKHTQQQAEAVEKHCHQLSIRQQLEEWQRLKGLAEAVTEAEQHVRMAHQHQEQLTLAALAARRSTTKYLGVVIACAIFFLLSVAATIFEAIQHGPSFVAFAGVAIVFVAAGAGWGLQYYHKAREREGAVDRQVQDAMSRVRMMVAAREAAVRMGDNSEALAQVEHELRALGSDVPSSLEEVGHLLAQTEESVESLADMQRQMQEKQNAANVARNQLNLKMEAVTILRKERVRLEEQRKREGWDTVEEHLHADQAALKGMQQEIVLLASQEGLPLPSVNARLQRSVAQNKFSSTATTAMGDEDLVGVPELDALVDSMLEATRRETAALDSKLDLTEDLKAQLQTYQHELDDLFTREREIQQLKAQYEANNPMQQVELARDQQTALRNTLQHLQESLRQRVKPLGIAFGQTTIASAEAAAREQLEELHIALANKMMLQEQHAACITLIKDLQESLAEYYTQLAKFSNSLGSWIMPPNPFPDALAALRSRCQNELQEADEPNTLQELDRLRAQEGACKAKVELCQQEISEAHERIATMLVQRNRPKPKDYNLGDIVTIWPLVAHYSVQDRDRLEHEYETLENELEELEKEELAMSIQLQTGSVSLDLEHARTLLQQQERSYQTKKWGNQLVQAVNERLMHKMMPRIAYYMQQILPLLTSGRYHDIHLTNQAEEGSSSGGPLQLRVWDTAAGGYVPKSAFSGGAADQLSLALRLAFAIAVLPRELHATPGFVLLDEPLISFDRDRVQALVDVFTGPILSQHFEQVMLISHSSTFDAAMFPYHVFMDNGLVVQSNLPLVNAAEVDDEEDLTVRLATVPIGEA